MPSRKPVVPRPRAMAAALPDRAHVGLRLRTVRKGQGLTLKALSVRSGVPLSTLSKIELGQVSVSYEKFLAVARALSVDVAMLFDGRAGMAAAPGGRPVTAVKSTLADAPRYDAQNYRYRLLAADYPVRQMTPMHGVIVARRREQFADFIRHAGQEFVTVLTGRVRIEFETGDVMALCRGESAYFDSGVGHVYLSTSRADAQVLVVMTAP